MALKIELKPSQVIKGFEPISSLANSEVLEVTWSIKGVSVRLINDLLMLHSMKLFYYQLLMKVFDNTAFFGLASL